MGRSGLGLFALPVTVGAEVRARYGVRQVGVVEGARVMYYAIVLGRKIENSTSQLIDLITRQPLAP